MLGVIGQFTGILGTMYYEKSLKDFEVRTMIYWSTVISIISGFASYAFANRWNLDMHISDIVFIVFTDTIF